MEMVGQVCGWVGSCISMFFFVSPIVQLLKLYKKEIKIKDIAGILLLCTLISCVLWAEYGIQSEKVQVWVCNSIGAGITIIWLIVYWIYFANCEIIRSIVYNVLFINVVGEIFYICYVFAGKEYNEIVGKVAMVFNVLMFAAPGEKIFQVLKSNDYNILPIYSSICGTCCSSFWGLYGLIVLDWNIFIPNILGLCFSIGQIIAWVIVYRRVKKNPQIIEPPSETQHLNISEN